MSASWATGTREVLKTIASQTSFHGFRFIGETDKHWSERLFWIVCVAASWYGSFQLISAQFDAFQNNPLSFVVETTYLDWDTHFPSVAICENENIHRIEYVSDALWSSDHDFNLEEVLKEIAYFKGITYYTSQFCTGNEAMPECPKKNLTYFANMVRSTCEESITNCSWRDEPFDCCEYFLPMDTEMGICYVINSVQGRDQHGKKLPMISNLRLGAGFLQLNVMVPAKVYLLNEEEVPSLTSLESDVLTVSSEVSYRRAITIRGIINDAAARQIAPVKRKCRYTDENPLWVYPHYSYSACTVQCRQRAQVALCACANFLIPRVPEHDKCDVEGLTCLNEHLNDLSVLKASWSSRPGLYCDCLPSCTEAEISIIRDSKSSTDLPFANVVIELAVLPSERYRRNVVRGALDLVVSMGGTTGLFVGASILSFVELLYIAFVRTALDAYLRHARGRADYWYERFKGRTLAETKFGRRPAPRKKTNPAPIPGDVIMRKRIKPAFAY